MYDGNDIVLSEGWKLKLAVAVREPDRALTFWVVVFLHRDGQAAVGKMNNLADAELVETFDVYLDYDAARNESRAVDAAMRYA